LAPSKLISLEQAVSRHVTDGCSVALGTALETAIPFAAGHEIIRQNKRRLTLIGPISDILFDQLIGAGCADRVCAAWVGNVITGSGYNFRRALEGGTLAVEDHSNLTLAMGLKAAALGVPFLPTRTALGSDLFKTNARLKTITCPFSGQRLTAAAAIEPDVAFAHVQRCDVEGNAHVWGSLGVTRDACLAGRSVVLTAEEIVSRKTIAADPNRVLVPGFRVAAVVHAPWGAHPSPVAGCYNRDHQAFTAYRDRSRTPEGFAHWKRRWIEETGNLEAYLELLGSARRASLGIGRPAVSKGVDYGF
jgi:glutaconate CoA-transferase subunit A